MNKRIRIAIAAATIVGGFTMTQAGSASAAHCFEDNTPGFSYFGNDHVAREVKHGGSPEGGNPGPHVNPTTGEASSGASACRADTGSPSTRAPGKQS